jgi:hypothetical protein
MEWRNVLIATICFISMDVVAVSAIQAQQLADAGMVILYMAAAGPALVAGRALNVRWQNGKPTVEAPK